MNDPPPQPNSPRSSSPRSSSPRREEAAVDAVLWSGPRPGGPVRLPRCDVERFVAEFNAMYASLGWKMDPAE